MRRVMNTNTHEWLPPAKLDVSELRWVCVVMKAPKGITKRWTKDGLKMGSALVHRDTETKVHFSFIFSPFYGYAFPRFANGLTAKL